MEENTVTRLMYLKQLRKTRITMVNIGRTKDGYIYKCPLCERLEEHKSKNITSKMCAKCRAFAVNNLEKEKKDE